MGFEYRKGVRRLVKAPLDSTSADILVGDAITASDATSGYFKEVDALAEGVFGIAASKVTLAAGGADGDHFVMVDVSADSVYEVAPDAGSVTQALAGKTMDVGADARSVDINGSTTDDVYCLEADVSGNKLYVQIRNTSYTGV